MKMQIIPTHINERFSSLLQLFNEESPQELIRIFQEGKVVDNIKADGRFLFLKSGVIKVVIQKGLDEVLLGIFKPGDLIDYSLFSRDINCYTLKAMTSIGVNPFELQKMNDLIALSPTMKSLEHELKECWMSFLERRFYTAILNKPIERVANLISDYLCIKDLLAPSLWNSFPINDLASYCNLTEKEFNYYYNKLIITGQLRLNKKTPYVLHRGKITI